MPARRGLVTTGEPSSCGPSRCTPRWPPSGSSSRWHRGLLAWVCGNPRPRSPSGWARIERKGGTAMAVIRAALAAALAVTLFAAPLAAEAQPPGKVPRIGLLDYSTPDHARLAWWDGFLRQMAELGHVEGQTVAFERRWARGEIKRLSGLIDELVALKVDIIVTAGT